MRGLRGRRDSGWGLPPPLTAIAAERRVPDVRGRDDVEGDGDSTEEERDEERPQELHWGIRRVGKASPYVDAGGAVSLTVLWLCRAGSRGGRLVWPVGGGAAALSTSQTPRPAEGLDRVCRGTRAGGSETLFQLPACCGELEGYGWCILGTWRMGISLCWTALTSGSRPLYDHPS